MALKAEDKKEQEILLSCIEKNQKTVSHNVEVHLENDGVNWKIQMSEEIVEAVFGDIQEAVTGFPVAAS